MSNNSHGGPRKGAGRPNVNKPFVRRTIALHAEVWRQFDKRRGEKTIAQFMRELINERDTWKDLEEL